MPSEHKTQGPETKSGTADPGKTPSADIQPEDTGTPASGNTAGRGTAAEAAMKQTSKTPHETGSSDPSDGGNKP
ncbi:MAG: hypothetical protein V4864_00580 [Pseudomonadota bacterium]